MTAECEMTLITPIHTKSATPGVMTVLEKDEICNTRRGNVGRVSNDNTRSEVVGRTGQ